MVLIHIFLMTDDIELIFMDLLAVSTFFFFFFFLELSTQIPCLFKMGYLSFYYWVMSSSCILDISLLSNKLQIFSHILWVIFYFLDGFLCSKVLNCDKSQIVYFFSFTAYGCWGHILEGIAKPNITKIYSCVFFWEF